MTPEQATDCEAIRQLLARATQAADARKAEAYAACFAPDGVLEIKGERHEGPDGIHAWMTAPSPFAQGDGSSPGFVSHHLSTCAITFTGPDEAKARTYWLVTTRAGIDHNGYYDDELVRVAGAAGEPGAWKLRSRKPRTLWINPESVLPPAS